MKQIIVLNDICHLLGVKLLIYFCYFVCIILVTICCFVVYVCFSCLVFVLGLHSFDYRYNFGSLDYSSTNIPKVNTVNNSMILMFLKYNHVATFLICNMQCPIDSQRLSLNHFETKRIFHFNKEDYN